MGNKIHRVSVLKNHGNASELVVNGKAVHVDLKDHTMLTLDKLGIGAQQNNKQLKVLAPMPGVILEVKVTQGQVVKEGDPLLILEAMKMENVVKAVGDATIKSIKAKNGQSVEKDSVLITFD